MTLPTSGSLFAGTQANTIASRKLTIGTPVWNYVGCHSKRLREDILSRLVKKKVQTVDQEQSYSALAILNSS